MNQPPFQFPCGRTRRQFLWQAGNGFFGTAMAWMLDRDGFFNGGHTAAAAEGNRSDLADSLMAPKAPHFPAKAKACIFLHMVGGPSQFDTFNPKPKLVELHETEHTFSGDKQSSQMITGKLKGSPFKFSRHGEAGIPVSELLPNIAERIDDVGLIHSTCADSAAHASACLQLNTGYVRLGFPCLGSWTSYGLGTVNQNIPGFVVIVNGAPFGGAKNWSSGFIPSAYQGTVFESGPEPIRNLNPASGATLSEQRRQLDLLGGLNQKHQQANPGHSELSARISAYELAYRMQSHAPEAVDISQEPEHVHKLYGVGGRYTNDFGHSCLLARRLVERGVRFVQLYHNQWDTHTNNDEKHRYLCRQTDKPIAGLITDLKQRGLFDETIIVWAGEFGRTAIGDSNPIFPKGNGRDHHAAAFTTFLAGGGIRGGQPVGETDELGYHVVRDRVHLHDLHATILHQMGMDHTKLTYLHQGRNFRITDVHGRVIRELVT